jgi:hypothetical protein
MFCSKRRKNKDVDIYLNNKRLAQVNSIKYLGIIFENKITFRDHVKYVEEKSQSQYLAFLNRQK